MLSLMRLLTACILAVALAPGTGRADVSDDLISAASAGDIDAVRSLLDRGADPNFANADGTTALGASLDEHGLELMELLIDRGADANAAMYAGQPLLYLLTWSAGFAAGATDTLDEQGVWGRQIALLVRNGADPTVMNSEGLTAWHDAVIWDQTTKLLIHAGADLNAENQNGETPLALAAVRVPALHRWDCEASSTPEVTVSSDLASLDLLLASGASVDHRNSKGESALFDAASICGTAPAMQRLILAGADANIANIQGATPLMLAARSLSPVNVSFLLKADADAEAVDNRGRSALFYVAQRVVEREHERLSFGFELPTLAHGTIREVVELIVEAGADPARMDMSGMTAVEDARHLATNRVESSEGRLELQELIRSLETSARN